MKSLPEAVQRAFPSASDRLSARPWWRVSGVQGSGAYSYLRMDDQHNVVTTRNFAVEQVAAYDAAHPLPHPGYRAGQVWAAEDGESIVVALTMRGMVCVAHDEEGWYTSTFAKAYPYLMADPACPHLAPWSPCEEKKP